MQSGEEADNEPISNTVEVLRERSSCHRGYLTHPGGGADCSGRLSIGATPTLHMGQIRSSYPVKSQKRITFAKLHLESIDMVILGTPINLF